ncbi:MAG TPA: hypothetical protein PKJ33_01055 [Alphaproteobacteria bacterium]|nr:hypothetical protein [Alphaproteobacteria bacterium]
MKKNNLKISNLFLAFFVLIGLTGCIQKQNQQQYQTVNVTENMVIDENSVPIFPKKAALTTDTARRFSIELPKRCEVDWNNQNVLSVVPEEKIEIVRLDTGDDLPAFNVSNYEFKKLTIKQTLDKLLDGTDIAVIADESLPQQITGSIQAGSLADSLELITKMGKAYYSYDDDAHEIHLSSHAKWLMKMPKDENIIMALLDAMHGTDMRNLLVDWEDKTVSFEGNYQTEREVSKIVSDVGSKKYMIAWDIDVYRVYPRTDNPIVWMNILPAFGDKNVKMSIPGVVGRTLVVSPEINTKTLQAFLSQQGNVVLISQGTFVIPNGWQSRFDIGQCGKEDRLETDLTIGASGKYGNYAGAKKIDAKIVLRTSVGELSSFKIPSTLGDNYVIIGIPTHSFVTTPETLISPFAELVVFMSPRVISIASTTNSDEPAAPLSGDALRNYLSE